ncbi:hypothetical protein HETIRDRAFT_326766 [Heterobasidion irregulare TC 32-1]|uniref:Uncharacterized protein n=1 Tax=Heterobasidion irregulare (strain TC 32-1) TaxID=747525 RepID=W4JWC8_HETIT|nr:uncharacterized protein HETIRDRAFT_326766 [Heterobasidion irregulare TC 32-1]ETW77191.1 hypothetical protein HETIRDRAFT_326766 [Heterobasidion irregulare TC 32-1]
MFIANRAVLTTYGAHNQVDVISMSKELGKQPWEIDDERLPDLWGLSAQWLLDRGYRLYNPCPENRYDSAICEPPQATQWDFQHPYAFHAYIPSQPFDEISFQRHLYPAQDEKGRDVVIKAVVKGSQELTIFRILLEVPEIFDPRTFPSIIPILNILDTPHDYMFVVMPRWGRSGMAFADVASELYHRIDHSCL